MLLIRCLTYALDPASILSTPDRHSHGTDTAQPKGKPWRMQGEYQGQPLCYVQLRPRGERRATGASARLTWSGAGTPSLARKRAEKMWSSTSDCIARVLVAIGESREEAQRCSRG